MPPQKEHSQQLKRVFLIGSNISKSISPAFQNKAFKKTGFRARYELLQFPESRFESFVDEMKHSKDVLGFNVTAPYKEMILPFISKTDASSSAIGSVNTVKILRSGVMNGYNTDLHGILESFSKLGLKKKDRAVVLGAGGAARACVYASLKFGIRSVAILNRSKNRAEGVRAHFLKLFPRAKIEISPLTSEDIANETRSADILINAVTNPFPIETDFAGASRSLKFFDLGYREQSSILARARRARIDSIDGLLMLVEQGARSFEIWTSLKAPRQPMLLAARRELLKPTREPFLSL
ncbi:MAG: shikimate dehydrogenase [Nitrososphaerota archaeon]|nr:shikimate dehydrogenase [Nitrososphaerota archaeon]